MLPTFLGIGTPRAATTWLFNCLREHPEIFLPDLKELHFFDEHYEKGIGYYTNYFDKGAGYKAIGEITPNYLACKVCPARIAQLLPDIKMIVILRNPIESAYSFYRKFRYPKTKLSFEETLKKDPWLLICGRYEEHLCRYFKCFPRDNFRILLYEDILNNSLGVVQDVYRFLEVDTSFIPRWSNKAANVSYRYAWEKIFDGVGLGRFLNILRKTPIASAARVLHQKRQRDRKLSINEATRVNLIEYFKEPNSKLEVLIGRDLSTWQK